jgi:hypothetical protein
VRFRSSTCEYEEALHLLIRHARKIGRDLDAIAPATWRVGAVLCVGSHGGGYASATLVEMSSRAHVSLDRNESSSSCTYSGEKLKSVTAFDRFDCARRMQAVPSRHA